MAKRFAKGTVLFWHDPDEGLGSGVGKVVEARSDVIGLEMLHGSYAEVLPSEVTPVKDGEVVGIEENGRLRYWNAVRGGVYVPGTTEAESTDLTDEERRRIADIRSQYGYEG
jgi:hypothetical protein